MVESDSMINSAMTKTEDGTIEITMTIPWATVQTTYTSVVNEHVKEAQLPGFRKGKAPKELVEKQIDKTHAYEDVVRKVIPQAYNDAITTLKLHPIVTPTVELKEATEEKDWIIIARTCEKPTVDLADYKTKVKEAKAGEHKKLWVPGQDKEEKLEEKDKKGPSLEVILKALFEAVKIILPALLIQNETNHLLSGLIDQTKKLGLTVEQYLASTGRTSETIRKEYEDEAKRTLTLEFALESIADKEGILVSDDDIDTVVKNAKTPEEQKSLEKERYYIANVLRRQKTLDFLTKL